MKIKLKRSGGLTGKLMSAQFDFELTKPEWDDLVEAIKKDKNPAVKKTRDAFGYTLEANDDEKTAVSINPSVIPEKYHAIFQKLFDGLSAQGK